MIYFLIPVYNEEENIKELSIALKSSLISNDKKFIFVNDGSNDNSIGELNNCFLGTNFHLISNEVNQGPGYSFNKGFEYILNDSQSPEDMIVTLEADNTSDLSILPKMIELTSSPFDLVLASVYAKGGGFESSNIIRTIISAFANWLFRSIYDVKIRTTTSFYRVYKIDLLRCIKNNFDVIIKESGYICMLEILLKSIRCNAKIVEIPTILNSSKRKGKSKMKLIKTSFNYIKFLIRSDYKIESNPSIK